MKSNLVKLHRWNKDKHAANVGGYVTRTIQLGEELELPCGDDTPPLAFYLCCATDHAACRSQHAMDEAMGFKVLQMRKGEVERVIYDAACGILEIYLRGEGAHRNTVPASVKADADTDNDKQNDAEDERTRRA